MTHTCDQSNEGPLNTMSRKLICRLVTVHLRDMIEHLHHLLDGHPRIHMDILVFQYFNLEYRVMISVDTVRN